jgi:hypothetical protein
MQRALDSIVYYAGGEDNLYGEDKDLLKALRDRLAWPEPEPVAFYGDQPLYAKRVHAIDTSEKRVHETDKHRHVAKNATSEWVGLTHDEAKVLVERFSSDPLFLLYQHESKLKEKNR